MNVEMPDGTVIEDVPEGTTQSEILRRYNTFKFNAPKKDVRAEQQKMFKEVMGEKAWGTGVPKAIYELGGKVTDITGSPAAGYATNVVLNAIPSMLTMTKGLPGPTPEQVSHNALVGQRGSVLQAGKEAGMVVPPTQANPSMTNRVLESIGGKAATAHAAANRNQDVIYKIAQKEAGLLPDEAITPEALKAARDRLSAPYREVAALQPSGALSQPPFKSARETIDEIGDLRKLAKEKWFQYGRVGGPSIRTEALEASKKADALETTLEAYANQAGRPDLIDKLRAARVALAKNYTVDRAMTGSSFDPAKLSKLESRGTPLGGDMETVMNMYRDFPLAMRAPQVGGSEGVSQLLPFAGGGLGFGLGSMIPGLGQGYGALAGVAASQAAPPVARSMILSPLYQSLMANMKPTTDPLLLKAILGNPALVQELEQEVRSR